LSLPLPSSKLPKYIIISKLIAAKLLDPAEADNYEDQIELKSKQDGRCAVVQEKSSV
jgi:hypothetical protein